MLSIGLFDYFLNLDVHLQAAIVAYGTLIYAILFVIIFCETGLVVTPFLPGDSLLFAAGAFAALGNLNIFVLLGLLCIAAILGDACNYSIGRWFGKKAFHENARFLKKKYLDQAEAFFARYGKKAIVLARFAPILRTFVPFVAGAGRMHYGAFATYNVIGGITWVALFVSGGYFFGNIPLVRDNFEIVILGIVFLSILVPLIEWFRSRKN